MLFPSNLIFKIFLINNKQLVIKEKYQFGNCTKKSSTRKTKFVISYFNFKVNDILPIHCFTFSIYLPRNLPPQQ